MAKLVCNFISYALKRTVDITVVLPSVTIPEAMQLPMPGKENPVPPTHEVKEKYPVLYLLHGMGNNHAQWTGYTNVEMFAEERNMAVVMISGENKFYHDSLDGEPFFDFVAKEVPEFVTNYFPISAEPEHSYIGDYRWVVTAHCCMAFLIRNGLQRLVPSLAQSCRWAIRKKWKV